MAPDSTRIWTRDFILLSLASFLIFTGFQMLMPTLPKYVAALGGDNLVVGFTMGIFTISAVLVRPWLGREMDRRGRRGIYLLGLLIFAVAVLGYSISPSILILFLFRLLHGAGWGGSTTAGGTIVTDILPPQRRAEGLGYYGLFSNLAMAIAPALGLLVLDLAGFKVLFFTSAALALAATLVAGKIKMPAVATRGGSPPAFFEPKALHPSLIAFFMTITYGGVVTFLTLYAAERGIANIGLFFTFYAAALMLIRPLAGMVADRYGQGPVLVPGLLAATLATLILALAGSLPVFLVAAVLYGLGFGAAQPTLQAMAVAGVAPNRRGAANGTFFSAFDLGIGLGSTLLGVVARFTGFAGMYAVASLFGLAGLLTFLAGRKGRSAQKATAGP
ncbi:Major facilitator superfamily [Moorella glycerini]|uniref:Tetracycline resistance protein, class B n=1 Tax=Neomoorella stamsii TaxID=1266720 RepID=A0A9X7J5K4_9FIRM|nr:MULTISPECIES: MFS transporter [Moorella]PRR77855.1 Tetracycline resistance protein, class B [Moorella stamsii]CEP68964.1 Major facilitator superfamily [Moorella glycerini]